jgi:hypothetical protein
MKARTDKHISFFSMPEGPVFPLLSRLGWVQKPALFVSLRLILAWGLLWAPLLILSYHQGGPAGAYAFLRDFSIHVRFLFAVPIFLTAGLLIEPQAAETLKQFVETGLIKPADQPRYQEMIRRTSRWVNPTLETVVILIIVFSASKWSLNPTTQVADTWLRIQASASEAGWWYMYISRPVFQFLILRWFWRVLIWDLFLWRVSRISLDLIATHPDRCGGLGFLGVGQTFFALIMLGVSAIQAGDMGMMILYQGESLHALKFRILIFAGLVLAIFLAPLLVFTSQLGSTRRIGLFRYGVLASHYVRRFQEKWKPGQGTPDADLLGTSDIQSLADLGNSFNAVQQMRLAPTDIRTLLPMIFCVAAPFVPLVFTVLTPQEILQIAKGILF